MTTRGPHLVPVVLLIGHDQESAVVDQVAEQFLHREAGVSERAAAEERGGARVVRAYIAVGFTVHLAASVGAALLHRSHSQTLLRRRRGRLLLNQLTVLDVWRLSVWLLARILNLSVQASRSSFTPTTESSEVSAKMSKPPTFRTPSPPPRAHLRV